MTDISRFTTNIDLAYTDDLTGVSVKPSLLLDFAKSKKEYITLTTNRTGTSTVLGRGKYITSVDENKQRINHDIETGECLGLLVERSVSNVCRNALSELGSYVTADSTIGPDLQTTFRAVPVGSVSFPGVGNPSNQSYSLSGVTTGVSRTYTYSGFFAPHGSLDYRAYVVITASGPSLTDLYALVVFNPTTGTFSGKLLNTGWSEVEPPKAVLHPSGFYYITWTVSFTQQASLYASVSNYLQILNQTSQQVYTADGVSGFKFACLQFEQGWGATSYIPTTTATVTRQADIVSYPTTGWFNPVEGTVFVDFKYRTNLVGTRVLSIGSSTTNAIKLLGSNNAYNTGPYLEIFDNNATPAFNMGPANPQKNTRYLVAFTYKAGAYSLCVNGGTPYTNSYASVPQGLSTLHLGSDNGLLQLDGHVGKFAYYPKVLSVDELKLMTTV